MKHLIFSFIGYILFIWNPLDIDPFANRVNEEVFSHVAPKEIVRSISTVGYIEAGVKLKMGKDCLKKNYDMADIIQDMPVRHSSEWNQRFHGHIQNTQRLCSVSQKINGY
jgi:hypothetical protein